MFKAGLMTAKTPPHTRKSLLRKVDLFEEWNNVDGAAFEHLFKLFGA